jgi:hypothetical protein
MIILSGKQHLKKGGRHVLRILPIWRMAFSLGTTYGNGSPGMSPYGQPDYPPPGGFGVPGMSPYGPPMAPEQEINFLRDQAQMLKQQMDQIDARIKELEKEVK